MYKQTNSNKYIDNILEISNKQIMNKIESIKLSNPYSEDFTTNNVQNFSGTTDIYSIYDEIDTTNNTFHNPPI